MQLRGAYSRNAHFGGGWVPVGLTGFKPGWRAACAVCGGFDSLPLPPISLRALIAIERITVSLDSDGSSRASEIVADLRNVAEALFHPLRLVAYWDAQAEGRHICPQADRGEECPHHLPPGSPDHVPYGQTVDRDLAGTLEVCFPHAGLSIYLGAPATLVDAFSPRRTPKLK